MSNATYKALEINNSKACVGTKIVYPYINFHINSIDVKETVQGGEIINIKVNVSNYGNANINTTVGFYIYSEKYNCSYKDKQQTY